ncbi:MAG TPA: hypothetical protein VKL61_11395 [Candidatus Polarisedimenticolia bacterium]|nr:hypothetical protein [Candidatus Polarisedimenticolia bacterium]
MGGSQHSPVRRVDHLPPLHAVPQTPSLRLHLNDIARAQAFETTEMEIPMARQDAVVRGSRGRRSDEMPRAFEKVLAPRSFHDHHIQPDSRDPQAREGLTRGDRPTQGDAGEVFPPVQALPDRTFGVARERRQEQQRACKDEGNPDRPAGSVQHGRGHFTPCEHEG